jgi:hypothetical protein
MGEMGKAKGGHARAKKLSKEERSIIAKKAALSRWSESLPKVICGSTDKPLRIANKEIECYVLDDGTRVLTQASFLEALGRHRKANVRREGLGEQIPAILQGKAIRPYITHEIIEKSRPIVFRTPHGTRAYGYRAELLPTLCEVYLTAKDNNSLPPNQKHVADQAYLLIRGLANVGIIALVDEATGYQDLRPRDALTRILEAFIAKELQPYVQTFPEDYYKQTFRLRGLSYPNDTVKRPQYFGILTNDVIYKRLAPGVLKELKSVTLRNENGRAKHKYFQMLTSNIGYPKLRELLGAVVAIMKLSQNWNDFSDKLNQQYPRYGDTIPLPLLYEGKPDDGKGL